MSEGKRPEYTCTVAHSANLPMPPVPVEVDRWVKALEAALVKVTEALETINRDLGLIVIGDDGEQALFLAAPLVKQIPAPQKESR